MTKSHMGFVIHTTEGDQFYCVDDEADGMDKAVIDHLDPEHAHEVHDEAAMEFCCVCGHVLRNKADK